MKYDFNINLNEPTSHSSVLKKISEKSTVLEFGPATGYMTKYMKEQLGCKVFAVELDPESAHKASKFCEKLLIGDIEEVNWLEEFKDIQFDYIIFADVLEHLKNPWAILKNATTLLKEEGQIIISIPNVAHNAIIMELLKGDFKYRQLGLLDDTHIRFFTNKTLVELLDHAGLQANNIDEIIASPEHTELAHKYSDFPEKLSEYLIKRPYGEVYQFVVSANKKKRDFKSVVTEKKQYAEIDNIQLFFHGDEGFFSQENSITQPIFQYNTEQSYEMELPHNQIKTIRIDPGNNPGYIELSIKLEVNQQEIDLSNSITISNGVSFITKNSNIIRFTSISSDPQIIIESDWLKIYGKKSIKIKILVSREFNQKLSNLILEKDLLVNECEVSKSEYNNLIKELDKERSVRQLLEEINNKTSFITEEIIKENQKYKELLEITEIKLNEISTLYNEVISSKGWKALEVLRKWKP